MTNMIETFKNNINPFQVLEWDGQEYQYNTIDSDGWVYWKLVGKGNDLGLKLATIASDGDDLVVEFVDGTAITIPKASNNHPLITIGV